MIHWCTSFPRRIRFPLKSGEDGRLKSFAWAGGELLIDLCGRKTFLFLCFQVCFSNNIAQRFSYKEEHESTDKQKRTLRICRMYFSMKFAWQTKEKPRGKLHNKQTFVVPHESTGKTNIRLKHLSNQRGSRNSGLVCLTTFRFIGKLCGAKKSHVFWFLVPSTFVCLASNFANFLIVSRGRSHVN